MSKREADGYCAWHKDEGWLGKEYLFCLRSDFEGAMEELREEFEDEFVANASPIPMLNLGRDFVPWIRSQGWKIRPVWLSTEPPEETPSINAAGLHKLISWAKWMASEHRRNIKTLNCDDSLYDILEDLELLLPKSEGENTSPETEEGKKNDNNL